MFIITSGLVQVDIVAKDGRTQAISHWDWDADHISCCTVSRHRSRAAAHAASKRMERSYAPRQGWQVICT